MKYNLSNGYKVDMDEHGNTRITYCDRMAIGFAGDIKMEPIVMSVSFPPIPATDSLIAQLGN